MVQRIVIPPIEAAMAIITVKVKVVPLGFATPARRFGEEVFAGSSTELVLVTVDWAVFMPGALVKLRASEV
jgi:hypothetical protein